MTVVPRHADGVPQWGELAIAALSSIAVAGAMIMLGHPLVAPAAGLVPIAVVIAFCSAFLLCVAFVIFSFFRIHEAFPVLGPLKIPQLLAMATLAVLGWHIFITRRIQPFMTRELRVFLIFFALITAGLIFASNRPLAIAFWTGIYWKIAVMTLAIAWLLREPWHYRLMARLLVAAGMAVAVVAIQNKLAGIGLVEGTRVTIGRDIGSVLGDPNDLALVLLFPLAFAIALVIYRCGFIDRLLGLAGTGLIVFVFMIAVTVIAIRRAVTALHADPATPPILRASATAVLAGLAGFCMAGTFLTQAFTWPLYILIAITASLSHIISKKGKV